MAQGYQTQGAAPGMQTAPQGAGGAAVAMMDISTSHKPLPVIQQSVSRDAVNAGRVAANAQLQAADIVANTILQLGEQTGQQTASIQREAEAARSAELAKQQREQELAAITREKYGMTVGDLSDPAAVGNQMAMQIAETAKQRQAIGDEILAKQSIGFMDDPFGWLEAQLTVGGLIDQHNTLVDKQSNLQADAQGLLQVANNLAAAQKEGIPAHTLEENHAAIVKIEEAATQRKLEAEMQLQVNKNAAAKSTAQLLQDNYGLLMGLDDRRRQVELQNINQLQEAVKWDATKQTRLYQEMRAGQANAAQLSVRRMEMAMGLQPGTGNALLDDPAIPKETRDHLMRYAFTGSIDSPEQATAISGYANRAKDPVTGRPAASSAIVEMSDMIVGAKQKFYDDAAAGRVSKDRSLTTAAWKTMSEADKSMAYSKHVRSYVQQALADKAFYLSPRDLQEFHGVDVQRVFPELTMYTAPGVAASPEDVFRAFVSGSNGNLRVAANKIANYERLKLDAVAKKAAITQAGIEAPTTQIYDTVYSGLFTGQNSIRVNLTQPSSVEHYLHKAQLVKE